MKKYFDNGTASIGSLCRKLPFLLLDLVGNSIDDYSLIVTYDAQNKNFLTKISTDLEEKFRIDNSVTKQGVNEANSLKILRKMFEKDKFVKRHVRMPRCRLSIIMAYTSMRNLR